MKTNLLSTLNCKKYWNLFFLTLLQLQLKFSEAGRAFRNCLSERSSAPATYEYIINYLKVRPAISPEERIWLCCGNNACQNCCSACPYGLSNWACGNLSGKIYCNQWPSNCKGAIDDFPINSIINNTCLDLNYAKSVVTSNLQGLDKSYAYAECNNGTKCYPSCTWDNDGWICGSLWGGTWGECFVTWLAPWPGPADKNPMLVQTTTTSPTSTTIQTNNLPSSQANLSVENDHLVEKITITIGAITGGTLAGVLTYFCYKKRRTRSHRYDSQLTEMELNQAETSTQGPGTENNKKANEPLSLTGELETPSYYTDVGPSWSLSNPHTDYTMSIEEVRNPQYRNPQWID